ncbi:surfeit locus protein 1, partial [Asbolus verrucosus]
LLQVVPASTFALGTWQVQRKKWKEDLIAKLREVTKSDPVALPEDLNELEKMEYRPVHVRGEFLHDQELYMGPRTLIIRGDAATKSQLMSSNAKQNQGYLVITPFKLADRKGWVPAKCKNPSTREKGQQKGEVDVIGVVRLHENRPNFSPKNQAEKIYIIWQKSQERCQFCLKLQMNLTHQKAPWVAKLG